LGVGRARRLRVLLGASDFTDAGRFLCLLIVVLLGQSNHLGRLVPHLHAQLAAGRCDAQVAVAHATHDVKGLSGRLLERQPERVGLHGLLDRRPHVRRRLEESIRGHQPLDALMRTLEVVRVDEKPQSPIAIREVGKDSSTQEFLPKRFPESLHLAERLRVLRSALDVTDALAPQLLLEVGLPAPRRVLAPLVGQDLLRRAVLRDPARQRLHHQRRALVVRHRPGHDEARVVVHEGCQVKPLVASEQKREDVRLPHLVGCRSLEASRPVLVLRRRRARLDEPRLVQDAAHLCLGYPEALYPCEHVTDATRAVLRVLLA
jgi:hypothetical protein